MTENILKFQPIPKRFMVWDKVGKQFLRKRLPDGVDMVFSIFELPLEIDCLDEEEKEQFAICQSTNQFDEDGKEIFEGDIVKDFDDVLGCVYFDEDILGWRVLFQNGDWDDLYNIKAEIVHIGHILSNPKLLEVEQHDNSL